MPNYRAIVIGINYIGTSNQLAGCINDAHNLAKVLQNKVGFKPEEINVMTDDHAKTSEMYPSRANLIAAFKSAVAAMSGPGDYLWVSYSGHGTYARQGLQDRLQGLEDDGRDEQICPADFQTAGLIIDNDLRKLLVDALPSGVVFRGIFDNCFSGTVLDTRYVFTTERKSATTSNLKLTENANIPLAKADAKYISGCTDSQTSADTWENGAACGALTFAILQSIEEWTLDETCGVFLNDVHRVMISGRYSQRPMLGSSLHRDIAKEKFFFKINRA